MNDNQFVVDLGDLKLSDDQRQKINAAIQKAVTGELATIELKKEVVLIPVNRWPRDRGPIINGIIVRDIKAANLENLLGGQANSFGNE
jgi:hypothetical protein